MFEQGIIYLFLSGWWFGVWNMTFIFPYIGNNNPNWLIFSEGLKPPTSYGMCTFYKIHFTLWCHQTWLAGKSPNWMEVSSQEITCKWFIFQPCLMTLQGMFLAFHVRPISNTSYPLLHLRSQRGLFSPFFFVQNSPCNIRWYATILVIVMIIIIK